MTANPPTHITQSVTFENAGKVLELVVSLAGGPREAFALVCVTMWLLNRFTSESCKVPLLSDDTVCEEFAVAFRSIREEGEAKH